MEFFLTWLDALIYPKKTFQKEKGKASLKLAVKNVGVAGFIAGAIFGLLFGLLLWESWGVSSLTFFVIGLIGSIILFSIFSIIGLFISSGIYFVMAKILGGKGEFTLQTYFISLFLAPLIILLFLGLLFLGFIHFFLAIPFAEIFFAKLLFFTEISFDVLLLLYQLYPLTIGLRETHQFGTGRAILTWLIPWIVVGVIFEVMIAGVVSWVLKGILEFIFLPGDYFVANTASGFGKIKVMDPSIRYYPSGILNFTIMNGAGQTVSGLTMTAGDGSCSNATNSPEKIGQLGTGSTKYVGFSGCDIKSGEDSFLVDVEFKYNVTVGGEVITREERGTIRGTVEPG